jgi:hypothetical protein
VTIAPLIGILLLAAPQQAQIKLASPGLSYVNVDAATGEFFLDYFAKQIELRGVRVTTNREIAALVGFERQKQLLNCGDGGTSCLAELAGALGVDGLITGSLAKVGSTYVINLKVVDNEARTLALFSERVKGDEALLDWFASASERLVQQLKQALKRDVVAAAPPKTDAPKVVTPKTDAPKVETPRTEPKVEPSPTPAVPSTSEPTVTAEQGGSGPNLVPWIPGIAGGVLLVGGAVSLATAKGIESDLRNGVTSIGTKRSDAEDKANEGRLFEGWGYGLMSAGVVGLGVTGALLLLTPADAPKVSVVPTAQGATVTLGGTF